MTIPFAYRQKTIRIVSIAIKFAPFFLIRNLIIFGLPQASKNLFFRKEKTKQNCIHLSMTFLVFRQTLTPHRQGVINFCPDVTLPPVTYASCRKTDNTTRCEKYARSQTDWFVNCRLSYTAYTEHRR